MFVQDVKHHSCRVATHLYNLHLNSKHQVLRVHPNSPGSRAGLKAYFDFIVAIGNTRFNKEDGSLREILKASVDEKLKMIVYNTRTKRTREVEIAPSTSWGGNGLLGVSIKHSSFDRAEERVWHVVEVEPGSPAHQAGFISNEDYVIGSDSILQENDDLYNLVEAHEGKSLKLFVYNIKTDNCRDVICHPNSKWGGKGYLGCEFGHGLLHRIPYGDKEHISNNPRASLLRNEQPIATQQIDQNYNNFSLQRALAQQQQLRQSQPDQLSHQKSQADQKPSQGVNDMAAPQPQAPKTFAQLANAQYQLPVQSKPAQDSYNAFKTNQSNGPPQQSPQQPAQQAPQQSPQQPQPQPPQQPSQQQQQSHQFQPESRSYTEAPPEKGLQHQQGVSDAGPPRSPPTRVPEPYPRPSDTQYRSSVQAPAGQENFSQFISNLSHVPLQQPAQQPPIHQSQPEQSPYPSFLTENKPQQQQQQQSHQFQPEQRPYTEAPIEKALHHHQGMGDTGPPQSPPIKVPDSYPWLTDTQYQSSAQAPPAQGSFSPFMPNLSQVPPQQPAQQPQVNQFRPEQQQPYPSFLSEDKPQQQSHQFQPEQRSYTEAPPEKGLHQGISDAGPLRSPPTRVTEPFPRPSDTQYRPSAQEPTAQDNFSQFISNLSYVPPQQPAQQPPMHQFQPGQQPYSQPFLIENKPQQQPGLIDAGPPRSPPAKAPGPFP